MTPARAGTEWLRARRERVKDAIVLTGANGVIAGMLFLTVLRIARVLGKAEFGEYAYAVALGGYASVFVAFAAERTMVRDLVQQGERRFVMLGAGFSLRLLLLCVVCSCAATMVLIPGEYSLTLGQALVVCGTALGGLAVEGLFDYWGAYRRHSYYNLAGKMLFVTMVCLPTLLLPSRFLSVTWIGWATVVSALLLLGLQYRYAATRISLAELRFCWADVKLSVRNNGMLWVAAITLAAYYALNRVVLKHVSGSSELGGYAAGAKLVDVAMLALLQISRLGRPRMAAIAEESYSPRQRMAFILRYFSVLFAVTLVFALPALLCPDLVLRVLYGSAYVGAAESLRVLGIYLLVNAAGLVASQYVISRHIHRLYFMSVVVGGVLAVVACYLLIPPWGATGAAWALLLSHGVSMLIYIAVMVIDLRSLNRRTGDTPRHA